MESPVRENGSLFIPDGTQLIETFGWHPSEGARRIDLHLSRMAHSASQLGFSFNRADAAAKVTGVSGAEALRCRLTLSQDGALSLTTAPLGETAVSWRMAIAPVRLQSDNVWLRHKTTHRRIYDEARAALPAGIDEMLFLNEDGLVCEGTITNLFLRKGAGIWLTPALTAGVLPGVLRQSLVDGRHARQADLMLDDLHEATDVVMGNSLRGFIPTEVLF